MFYSQYGQDKFLEETVFKGHKAGFFMDIGAHDGVTINNTLYFEKTNGWTGINVEPLPTIYEKLRVARPSCLNLNCAVSNQDGYAEFFCNSGYTEMLSGLKKNYDNRHFQRLSYENAANNASTQVINVKTKRIETICDEYKINHINYLSIDVEGAELDVIQSINFETLFIDVIQFENNYDDMSAPIIQFLESKHYKVLHAAGDIFMIHKHSKFIT